MIGHRAAVFSLGRLHVAATGTGPIVPPPHLFEPGPGGLFVREHVVELRERNACSVGFSWVFVCSCHVQYYTESWRSCPVTYIIPIDYVLGLIGTGLSLARVFSWVFTPVGFLLGVPPADVPAMADLLGTKLALNEFVSYVKLSTEYQGVLSDRSRVVATFALTGFANFGTIGILLGGIGGMAPSRRADLARLSSRALLAGYLATLINASIASMLL